MVFPSNIQKKKRLYKPLPSKAFPTGIEPAHTASEADALSTELREHRVDYTIKVNDLQLPLLVIYGRVTSNDALLEIGTRELGLQEENSRDAPTIYGTSYIVGAAPCVCPQTRNVLNALIHQEHVYPPMRR